MYFYTIHNHWIATGLDIKVSRLREENTQVATECDRLAEEKTKWLQTQQAMKEENMKLAKDLESKYSSTLSYRLLKFIVLSSTLSYLINITPCSCEEKCQIAPREDEERLR
jgi:cell shape-determining protein MreC